MSGLKEVEQPMLAVSKSDTVMQVLPAALRFWEKLGLRPRGGAKDVTAFTFFDSTGETREAEIADWLDSLSQAYLVRPGRYRYYWIVLIRP
jgi:mediator of RNA polymerase II transcription subunit 13, fungi type